VRSGDIKRAIIVPPGWTFVACDYAQLEYRIAAYLSSDKHLYDIFLENRDLHTEVATGIFNKPADQITSKERYVAKFVDFGILYGRSAYSLAEGELECSVAEAQKYIDNFLKHYSSLKAWMAERWPEVLKNGYVENFFGRRRRFPVITKEVQIQGPKQAVNAPIQSLASDLTLLALVDMLKELDPNKARPLWTIHDAINLEIRTSCLDQQIRKVKEIMERERLPNCPILLKVDIKCGSNWGDAKGWKPKQKGKSAQ
jgi:DNA polymerase-1